MDKAVKAVIYDGDQWRPVKATIDNEGVITTADNPPLRFLGANARQLWPDHYLLCSEVPALLRETDFHAMRKTVVAKWLFSNDGDFFALVQQVSGVVAVVLAVIVIFTVHGLSSDVSTLSGSFHVLEHQQSSSQITIPPGYQLVPYTPPATATPTVTPKGGK